MNLHHELFLINTGLDRCLVRPDFSIATILHEHDSEPREAVSRAIKKLLSTVPRPGTLAADLNEDEKMTLAVAAGASYAVSMEDGSARLRTTVPVGFADRPGGGYFVAIGQPAKPGLTVPLHWRP